MAALGKIVGHIATVSEEVERRLAPFAAQLTQLDGPRAGPCPRGPTAPAPVAACGPRGHALLGHVVMHVGGREPRV